MHWTATLTGASGTVSSAATASIYERAPNAYTGLPKGHGMRQALYPHTLQTQVIKLWYATPAFPEIRLSISFTRITHEE